MPPFLGIGCIHKALPWSSGVLIFPLYSASMASMYFFRTTRRLSFIVWVSIPFSSVKFSSSRRNFFGISYPPYFPFRAFVISPAMKAWPRHVPSGPWRPWAALLLSPALKGRELRDHEANVVGPVFAVDDAVGHPGHEADVFLQSGGETNFPFSSLYCSLMRPVM